MGDRLCDSHRNFLISVRKLSELLCFVFKTKKFRKAANGKMTKCKRLGHSFEIFRAERSCAATTCNLSPYSSVTNKRTCTPYLISTKLPTCTLLFGTESLSIFLNFSQIFRLNLEIFLEKLGIFWKVFLIINKVLPCTLVFWSKFHPVRLFDFCQNSTLCAYSGLYAYSGD